MANLINSREILKDALRHSGELIDGTSPYHSDGLDFLNEVYREIITGATIFSSEMNEIWSWARAASPGTFVLEPAVDVSVSCTIDSTAGVFAIAPSVSLTGRFLKITDNADWYRIKSHVSGSTSFVLDQGFVQSTISGASAQVHKLEYELSVAGKKIANISAPIRVFTGVSARYGKRGEMSGIADGQMQSDFPLSDLEVGTPTNFSRVGEANGKITIRVSHSPYERIRGEFSWVETPADLQDSSSSVPLVPLEHRSVLVYGTAFWLLSRKEDSRADKYFQLTKAKLESMLGNKRAEENNTGRNFAKLQPRQEQIWSRARRFRNGILSDV